MESVTPVFDTNILIDYLLGKDPAKVELGRFPQARISVVTWIEVMVGAQDETEETQLRRFLSRFEQIFLDASIAETAAMLRSCYRLRLPDAVIWASAKISGSTLITRNTKDYPDNEPDIRFPYAL
jgi:predicted nucleic acid-binding protein